MFGVFSISITGTRTTTLKLQERKLQENVVHVLVVNIKVSQSIEDRDKDLTLQIVTTLIVRAIK